MCYALPANRHIPLSERYEGTAAVSVQLVVCKRRMHRTGVLSCKPNAKNPRDLDITLEYEFAGKNSRFTRTQAFRMR